MTGGAATKDADGDRQLLVGSLFDDDLDAVADRLHDAAFSSVGKMWANRPDNDETAAV